jgi:hypothetical protein
MQVYTIVLYTRYSEDPDGDVMSWAANMLDTEVMRVRGLHPSVLRDNTILRVETDLKPTDYLSHAFQGGLNEAMRDPSSGVIWWKVDESRGRVADLDATSGA